MEATQVMKLNSVGYLRLAYVATEITLHRRIMLALSPSTDPQLRQICRSVAHERFIFAIDFVQSLKPQHLSSFWYFASPQNFALIAVLGTLLLSTAVNAQDAEFYRTKLREYRWTLKINSENGARYMRPAIALLDANLELLAQSNDSSQPQPVSAKNTGYSEVENGSASADAVHINQFATSTHDLSSGRFSPPGQLSFDMPYYPGQHSENISPAAYSTTNTDAQSEEFSYGIGNNNGLWY